MDKSKMPRFLAHPVHASSELAVQALGLIGSKGRQSLTTVLSSHSSN